MVNSYDANPMSQPTFLVTGAHGFIGAWVIKQLVNDHVDVVIFDRSADAQRLRMIMSKPEVSHARFFAGDISDPEVVAGALSQHHVTHVVHLAGLQVPACRADPRMGALVNVIGTINVFEAARRLGTVVRIVYASSAAVFGTSDDERPLLEREAGEPNTHYGSFKRCNENNARVYYQDDGIDSIGLRPLTVYGPGRDFGITSDPTKAMKAAVVGRPFHIRFGGRTDFQYVADTAATFIRAATSDLRGAHVFNLHGDAVAVKDVIGEIERALPEAHGLITSAETLLPVPPELDDSAIRRALGPLPSTPLADGVRSTIERFALLHREGRLDTFDLDN
jgi:nucleoside-diphosphate-sugar epimerase